MKIEAVFLDMDGVIADFDEALRKRGVVDNETAFIHLPKYQWTAAQVELDRRVRECMESADFWPDIPLMAGARALWNSALNFDMFVLTATSRETKNRDRIESQKRAWIQAYFAPFPNARVIVCQRAEKKLYAGPGRVLIDDMAANCQEWDAAGGTAILFKTAADAIGKLEYISKSAVPPLKAPLKQVAPALRPRNSVERKAEPIHSGVMRYFPDALAAVARISKAGNDQHNPGEPLHWARGKSMDQMDASARHMLTLDEIDQESSELEAAHNAWRALAELQLLEEKRLAQAGIRPYSGVTP